MSKLSRCMLVAAILTSAAVAPAHCLAADAYPQITLTNGIVTLSVYRPDGPHATRFYQGQRFDGTGLIGRATWHGHTFFGNWQSGPHDPRSHDAVCGPAEEFDMEDPPPGYAEAIPGGTFYKIGVGALRRLDTAPYQFYRDYPVVAPAAWTTTHGKTWVAWTQTVHGVFGWGWRCTKRLDLLPGQAAFRITHRLENLGTRPLTTTQYCHNFVQIDGDPAGPAYRVQTAFTLHPLQPDPFHPTARLEDHAIIIEQPLKETQALWAEFSHLPQGRAPGPIVVENTRTGAALRIEGDQPLDKFRFYAAHMAVCPEPFLTLSLPPQGEALWHTRYTFENQTR